MEAIVNPTQTVPNYSAAHQAVLEVELGQAFKMITADRFLDSDRGVAPDPDRVGALVGPVHIRGARAGDTLRVEVLAIAPAVPWAYLMATQRYGLLGDRIEPRSRKLAIIDDRIEFDDQTTLPYRPMIGKIGLAPAEASRPSNACGSYGGAVSNTQLGPGAEILLEVHHDGGLLCLEDCHATMGDGEATSSAVEMASEVSLRCTLVDDSNLRPPLILTAREALTLGHGATLDEAMEVATEQMLQLIMRRRDVDLTEAALLVGAAADVRTAFVGAAPRKAYVAIDRNLLRL